MYPLNEKEKKRKKRERREWGKKEEREGEKKEQALSGRKVWCSIPGIDPPPPFLA